MIGTVATSPPSHKLPVSLYHLFLPPFRPYLSLPKLLPFLSCSVLPNRAFWLSLPFEREGTVRLSVQVHEKDFWQSFTHPFMSCTKIEAYHWCNCIPLVHTYNDQLEPCLNHMEREWAISRDSDYLPNPLLLPDENPRICVNFRLRAD